MGKRENRLVGFILIGLAVALILFSLVNVFTRQKAIGNVEYDVFFIVKKGGIGFDINNTVLTFGQVAPGGGAMRSVNINNSYNFPVNIQVLVSKNIQDLIEVNPTYQVLSHENISIPVELNIPEDFPEGNYSGKLEFIIYKAD